MFKLVEKVFGSANDRMLKAYMARAKEINALEGRISKMTDEQLKAKTPEFKQKIENGASLEDIMYETYAVVREVAKRTLHMRHFDVQLVGGMVLHEGKIAEMRTGEGKTLVATLPIYLNALTGKGTHVVTVNDYLAKRDAQWMGVVYKFLGLSVGSIVHGLSDVERRAAYRSDVTYGTNNEFGFDYLRDNMKFSIEAMAQKKLNFGIVDEVDSILIDEARTPLIISGPSDPSTDKYVTINRIIPGLKLETHFHVEEKSRAATLTEEGVAEVERRLNIENLYDSHNIEILHHVIQGLKAHAVFKCDVDYVKKDGRIMIVDEFTGRIMPGRRWSDGLHQAIEAKEGVNIESENQTLASITFQNFFRMYSKLAGMTGTALTEAEEFQKIYGLGVVAIPTNRPIARTDLNDAIYKSEKAKFKAVVEDIKEENKKGRPILIGTIAIEKSEQLSKMLERNGVRHNVLNAKQHDREAEIIAQAGRYGSVTVSTNMAGRGTDIMLGGNPEFLAKAKVDPETDPERYQKVLAEMREQCAQEHDKVVAVGGLYVLGTERHESRRIDNQLRGRTARQGDPGQTRFYISLEDELMRRFGSERISNIMERLGMHEDDAIEHKWITGAIEGAQRKVEGHNFDIRKHVLDYDDVMNQQRRALYDKRRKILAGEKLHDELTDMTDLLISGIIDQYGPDRKGKVDAAILDQYFFDQFGFHFALPEGEITEDTVGHKMFDDTNNYLTEKESQCGKSVMDQAIKFFMLTTLDELWKDHLLTMDHLREGIGLRGYGQKDPKNEYKKEGFSLFQDMMFRFSQQAVEKIFKVRIRTEEEVALKEELEQEVKEIRGELKRDSSGTVKREIPKIGRNDPCPCGSGKKYKKCHGKGIVAA
ncbi:preprotein translocase subunit SecA [bacterium]|nr:preprotein translocase subunit SecA [bacterium]MBU1918750.1 preprotein translocase subunit SecA [bacterium]